jgi:hypothetical protein
LRTPAAQRSLPMSPFLTIQSRVRETRTVTGHLRRRSSSRTPLA